MSRRSRSMFVCSALGGAALASVMYLSGELGELPWIKVDRTSSIAIASETPLQSPDGRLTIEITEPKDGAKVPERVLVRGTVSDPKAKVWVLVHPLKWSDYYVQPLVDTTSAGRWKVMVYIGKGDQGVGEPFDIRAFANPRTIEAEGQIVHAWPEADASSDPVEVLRE